MSLPNTSYWKKIQVPLNSVKIYFLIAVKVVDVLCKC